MQNRFLTIYCRWWLYLQLERSTEMKTKVDLSAVARKAWVTRRKNELHAKRRASCLKGWETIRATPKRQAALKAWRTLRKKNAS
jgi:hypothetical protein